MRRRDPGVYLEDVEHYAAAAVRFATGYDLNQYLADDKTRAAVERSLEICGEAKRKLFEVASNVARQIPHARDTVGFRNILAHGYAQLDHAKVHAIVIVDAPELLQAVRTALSHFPDPSPTGSE